ncbi:MAG: phosphoenolpyruvate--protein phosphotransferase [Prochloraceae cyanobacterium]
MVGIVIVSHSAKLAAGIEELATQMTQVPVQIATAAGIDDPENPFGTDAIQVQAAIESVYSEDGVVVLMDLGSAVLSAEMALELLPTEKREKVKLCSAPLVEGAIAAVVQAAAGVSIEEVIAEARTAIAAKASQLSEVVEDIGEEIKTQAIISSDSQKTTQIQLTVQNTLGIHARPAAKFVATAAQFQSPITLQNLTQNSNPVNAKSINQVITLGILQGHQIAITAVGEDAQAAIVALKQLVKDNFGEKFAVAATDTKLDEKILSQRIEGKGTIRGLPASPGVAIGSLIAYQTTIPEVRDSQAENPQTEWQKLESAIQAAKEEIKKLGSRDNTGIFETYLLFLADPVWLDRAQQLIFDRHYSAAAAWKEVIEQTIATYQSLEDSYLQTRAIDVKDLGMRVLRLLTGVTSASVDLPRSGILVAYDLTPSEVIQLKSEQVLGICTAAGNPTAHSALIANMLGIPMVVGLGSDLLQLTANTQLALDGETGQVWIDPSEEQLRELQAKQSKLDEVEEWAVEAITRDGYQIPLMANIIGVRDAEYALDCGASGVGLLRTEFLYLDRLAPPSEEEQLEIYQAIASVVNGLPLTIRTLDIGGDKPIPYLNLEAETNPFLGWRGIRQSLDCREMLTTQLRAILRASPGHNLKIMFPMVASVQEVRAAKEILSEVQKELRQAGIAFAEEIPVGIMIEVPAAVIMAHQLAAEVDFFSIGTNDLSQYVMAADRTNPKVSNLADALEPAVLRMIQQTVIAARVRGINVSVCGQLASNPTAIPILLGLGVDELSLNPPAISTAMATISQLSLVEAEAIADEVLHLDCAQAVKEHISRATSF